MSVLLVRRSGGSAQSDAESDWLARSTAAGVIMATRFDTEAEVTDWTLPNEQADHVTWETSIKRSGSGSLRFDVLNADEADSGVWGRFLNDDETLYGNGSTFYVQYGYYSPQEMWRYRPASGGGYKLSILSHHTGTNQTNEIVVQNSLHRGFFQLYWQDGAVTAVEGIEARSTPCNGTNFALQPEIDTGSPASPSTCAEYANRHGPLYDYGSGSNAPSANDITSQGHPRTEAASSGVVMPTAEWATVLQKVTIGTLGTASSRIEIWIARPGEDYTKTHDMQNITLGTGNGGLDYVWLLPYDTSKGVGEKGVDTFVLYDEVIVSLSSIAAPGGYAAP